MQAYLSSTEYINWEDPDVFDEARRLANGLKDPFKIAEACFCFVRDEIKHSLDYELNPVTCSASDALAYGTGYCYAKSHLLAALLRANAIPAGLCYQRLTIKDDQPPFCIHGLTAVLLPDIGWYRVDPRGNRSDIQAEFCPPREKLAFSVKMPGEADLPEIWAEPLPAVVKVLTTSKTYMEVAGRLPDVQLIGSAADVSDKA